MSINLGNLELKMIERILSSSSLIDIQTYSKVIEKIRNGSVYTVGTYDKLPDPFTKEGLLYYVITDEIVYYSNSTLGWVPLQNSVANIVYGWGDRRFGRIGDNCGDCGVYSSPIREYTSDISWSFVNAGTRHTSALKSNGTLWTWGGEPGNGVAGDNTCLARSSPTQETTRSENWCFLTASVNSNIAIKDSGTLWGWGSNSNGRLSLGDVINRSSPTQEITSSENWLSVSAWSNHASGVKSSGEIWSWGSGANGRLGNNCTLNTSSPVQEFSSSTNWCMVSAGGYSTHAIKSDGSLWSWGANFSSQLGNGIGFGDVFTPVREISSGTNWKSVSSHGSRVHALKQDNTLWSWGIGSNGDLANNCTLNMCSPVQEFSSSFNWLQVCNGSAVKNDGTLWGWGSNSCYAIGVLDLINYSSPVQEFTSSTDWCLTSRGGCHAVAIKSVSL